MDVTAITVEVQKLTLQPGDVLALKVDHHLPQAEVSYMQDRLHRILPTGVAVVILGPGFEFQVVRREQQDEQTW